MEFTSSENWGSLASALGLLVSLGGLIWAIRVARGARTAAQAAERATAETTRNIQRYLTTVDIERANARIEYVKNLHRDGRWEAALAWYQELRTMLYDIRARLRLDAKSDDSVSLAVAHILDIEFSVDQTIQAGLLPDAAALNQVLSEIQAALRDESIYRTPASEPREE